MTHFSIDDGYSPISRFIDMIQAQNKMLTIWLLEKVYFRPVSASICLLQSIEDDDVSVAPPTNLHTARVW